MANNTCLLNLCCFILLKDKSHALRTQGQERKLHRIHSRHTHSRSGKISHAKRHTLTSKELRADITTSLLSSLSRPKIASSMKA